MDSQRVKPLNPRQRAFVAHYLANGGNATQAYIAAGYSERGAKVGASKLLTVANVQAAISGKVEAALSTALAPLEIKAAGVLEEIARIAFSNIADVAEWSAAGVRLRSSAELSREVMGCVESVKDTKHGVELKMRDKLGALVKLGEHLGIFRPAASGNMLGDLLDELRENPSVEIIEATRVFAKMSRPQLAEGGE